jgi:hypothetical protein
MGLGLLLSAASVAAQEPPRDASPAWTAGSGDALVDARLADINAYAARYPDAFVDELVRYFDAPRALVVERLGKRGATAADVYYACAIARVAGRPCRGVLDARDRAPAEDWSSLAAGLGVAPGSSEAARLQQAIVDSYRRWARPLPDASPAPRGQPKPGKPGAS